MKTLILALLLVPLITFAHGKDKTPPPVCTPDTVGSSPGKPVSPPPVVSPVPTSPVLSPVPSKTAPTEGGSQIWCSGPTAPGYRNGVPYGGCANLMPKPLVIHLNQLPRTGLTFWQWLWQLI